jgi:outer membrane protein
MRRPFLLLILTFSLLATPLAAHAQAMKIAVVDFQAALNDVEEGKKARKVLETRFEEKRLALEARRVELESMREGLTAQAALLSEDSLRAKESEFNTKAVEFQQDMMEAQQEMSLMEQELTGGILEKLLNVAQAIGKEQGYTLVIEAQAVVFAVDSLDLTSQVVARFNAKQ